MDRGATAAAITQLGASFNRPFHLVEMHFTEGIEYITDAFQSVTWGGNEYQQLGDLLSVEELEESITVLASRINVILSAVDQAFLQYFLSRYYINRRLRIYRAFLDASWAVVADPILIFEGIIDEPVMAEDPGEGKSTLVIRGASVWVDFTRSLTRSINDQQQQALFPTDRGFEFVSQVSKPIAWGRPALFG